MTGLEPATSSLQVRRSTNLSYTGIVAVARNGSTPIVYRPAPRPPARRRSPYRVPY